MDGDALMETRILENSLTKICSLLAVGFGDAGAEVIGDNIKSGGDLNPMVPGHRITAVFGFCDIRNFTDATEVLQVQGCHEVSCCCFCSSLPLAYGTSASSPRPSRSYRWEGGQVLQTEILLNCALTNPYISASRLCCAFCFIYILQKPLDDRLHS